VRRHGGTAAPGTAASLLDIHDDRITHRRGRPGPVAPGAGDKHPGGSARLRQ